MSKQVVVIDYGIGNVFSVCNALSRIGASPILTRDPVAIANAERVVLPGVGAFSKAMYNLQSKGLIDSIVKFVDTGRPFLGICIGMQVLMDCSVEFGNHTGLGLIPGRVIPIPNAAKMGEKIKIPHIGWSEVKGSPDTPVGNSLISFGERKHFYFTHSYVCEVFEDSHISATTAYHGNIFTAVIGCRNILGVQFHPERSGENGLKFLRQFLVGKIVPRY